MKQEMITYLSTIKDDIFNLSKYLYDNPEGSFNEHNACNYIVNILKKYNFEVTSEYLKIPTAFYAQYGNGHPKICFFCEYDAIEGEGHVTGHNLVSSMSVAASIALTKVIDKLGGTLIVLGCPGEYISGAKVTMAKQGVFKDIDVALMAHPDIYTNASGTSSAILPIKIHFNKKIGSPDNNVNSYSTLDACSLTYNIINLLSKGFPRDCIIDKISIQSASMPHLLPGESEFKFYIRAPKMKDACEIEKKIKELVKTISNIMNISYEICLYELPYDELLPNRTLSRIFSNNLKECGVIDMGESKDTLSGLSLGTVSQNVPCIHPYISIVEDSSIKYHTKEFAKATISHFAQSRVMKTAEALAFTALDLIEKEELLQEVKKEFYTNLKNNKSVPCDVNK